MQNEEKNSDEKVENALDEIKAALREDVTEELLDELKTDDNSNVCLTGDGVGVVVTLDMNDSFMLKPVIKRTWKKIFLNYQGTVKDCHDLGQLEDCFECLKIAEKGVAAVSRELKQLRAVAEARRNKLQHKK